MKAKVEWFSPNGFQHSPAASLGKTKKSKVTITSPLSNISTVPWF